MAASWENGVLVPIPDAHQAVVDLYDYFRASSFAALKCVLPLQPHSSPFPVLAFPHYEVIRTALLTPNMGVTMPRAHRRDGYLGGALRFRQFTQGPELQLVDEFLHDGLPAPLPGERLSIMVEPKVEASFPDVVAAYWSSDITSRWLEPRRALTKADIRLVHGIHMSGGLIASADRAVRVRGRAAERAIERLIAAGVIEELDGDLRMRPLEDVFALRRLICVEAKISSPARALEQAVRASWFASEVYLLVPNLPSDEDFFRIASMHGVGIVLPNTPIDDAPVPATVGRLPRSYATWLFNEWVWRLSLEK